MSTAHATPPEGSPHGESEPKLLPAPSPLVPPGRFSKLLGQLVVPTLVLVGAVMGWLYISGGFDRHERETLSPEELAVPAATSEMKVTAEPIAFRSVQRVVEAVGTLYGFEEIVISAKVEGRVLKINHEVADRVEPDELLLQIDPTDYQLRVDQEASSLSVELSKLGLQELPAANFDLSKIPTVMLAQAKLDNAQAKYDRVKRLASSNSVTQTDIDNATSEFRTAQAEHANQILVAKSGLATIQLRQSALAIAQQQLADTRILVPRPLRGLPESGIVYVMTNRAVAEGTFVRIGGELCRLAIDQTLKHRVPVPERYTSRIKLGQQAEVITTAFQKPFTGEVTLINPAVDSTTRTFDVEIQIDNSSGQLKPGSFAKAIIHTDQKDEAPTVPLKAVVSFAGVTKIFLAENGKAVEVPVTLGVQTREWVEIAKPEIPRGTVVITSGQTALANGSSISLRGEVTAAKSGEPTKGSQEASEISRRPSVHESDL